MPNRLKLRMEKEKERKEETQKETHDSHYLQGQAYFDKIEALYLGERYPAVNTTLILKWCPCTDIWSKIFLNDLIHILKKSIKPLSSEDCSLIIS